MLSECVAFDLGDAFTWHGHGDAPHGSAGRDFEPVDAGIGGVVGFGGGAVDEEDGAVVVFPGEVAFEEAAEQARLDALVEDTVEDGALECADEQVALCAVDGHDGLLRGLALAESVECLAVVA